MGERLRSWAVIAQALSLLSRTSPMMAKCALGHVDRLKWWESMLWLRTSDRWHRDTKARWV